MKKILLAVALSSTFTILTTQITNAESSENNKTYVSSSVSLSEEINKACQEVAQVTNLCYLSSNSPEFKEVTSILNKIQSSTNLEEINSILIEVDGTNASNHLNKAKEAATTRIAKLTNLGNISTLSQEFKVITQIFKEINESKSISEVNRITEEFEAKVNDFIKLKEAKTSACQEIARLTNLASTPSTSNKFAEIVKVLKNIENANSITEVNHIFKEFIDQVNK